MSSAEVTILRTLLIALGASALVWLALPLATARADNGPHSSGDALSAGCAACHRIHTATTANLLRNSVPGLCMTCHAGLGSTTNVADGQSTSTPGRGLKGGGFVNANMDTNWDGASVSLPVTSSHVYDGTTSVTMWGNGAPGSGAGLTGFNLSCVNCHNPHGGAGTAGAPTYRILRPIPTGSGAPTGIDVADETTKRYTVTSPQNKYAGELYFGSDWEPIEGFAQWCAQCHSRYDAVDSGTGHTDSGDTTFAYRHMTRYPSGWLTCSTCHGGSDYAPIGAPDPLGLIGAPGSAGQSLLAMGFFHEPACENCHVAHGTSAAMSGPQATVAWPDASSSPSGDHRSSLLRLDNRGICRGCHGK